MNPESLSRYRYRIFFLYSSHGRGLMTRITTKEALKPRFITELAFKYIKIISSRR